jgi:hypothetical protein
LITQNPPFVSDSKQQNMKLKLLFPVLSLIIASILGCKKESTIQPDILQPEYTLPQGNHPYDSKIVDFYNKYGTYFLYKFTEKDFRWNISDDIEYVADPGDQNYVGESLEIIDKQLFAFYNESFLKVSLPYKILLSSRVRALVMNDTLATPVNAVSTFSHLTFGQASSRLSQLTQEELRELKADLHVAYWSQAISNRKVKLPPAFVDATDYSLVMEFNKKRYGVFDTHEGGVNADSDFIDYIGVIVSNTSEQLENTIFLVQNDPAGRYRYKYNAIINYYKSTYGIDLQFIGNSK